MSWKTHKAPFEVEADAIRAVQQIDKRLKQAKMIMEMVISAPD